MKKFPFQFRGQEYHLRRLDQDAKDDLLDRLTAGRLRQCERMYRKGLRTAAEYVTDRQAAFVKWGSEAFNTELNDMGNARAFVRALVVEPLTDAECEALVAELVAPESGVAVAVRLMAEDDDPKATAPTG